MNAKDRLLTYLQDNPTWHYGLDLVEACNVARGSIYVHLGGLEDEGLVERREVHSEYAQALPRSQYRIAHSGHAVGAEQPA